MTAEPIHEDDESATHPRGRRCEHLTRGRVCTKCVNRRRKAQHELEAIAPVHSSQRRQVLVRTIGTNTMEFDTDVRSYDVYALIKSVTDKVMKNPTGRGWLVAGHAADDVMAAIEASPRYYIQVTL